MPKISVIIPVYNVEKYLTQCLDSVIKQSFDDIEIICVDNGASSAEKEILLNYSKNDERVKLIHFEQNQGYGKAVNSALDVACGEYIGIVESDDYIEADMSSSLYSLAKEFDADVVKSPFYKFDAKSECVDLANLGIPVNKVFRITEYPILFREHPSIWSCVYKKEFLDKNNIRFREVKGTGWVDNPFQVETLLMAEKIVFADKPFYHYRDFRPQSASSLDEGIMVPYKATCMVHEVLEKLNIRDDKVFEYLAWREKAYISIILGIMSYKNRELAQEAVTKIFDIIGSTLDGSKKFARFKRRYYKRSLLARCIKNEFKKIVRKIFRSKK